MASWKNKILVGDDGRTDCDGLGPENVIKYVRQGTSEEDINELKKKYKIVIVRGSIDDNKNKKAKKVAAPVAAKVKVNKVAAPIAKKEAKKEVNKEVKKEKVQPRQTRSTNPILPARACKK